MLNEGIENTLRLLANPFLQRLVAKIDVDCSVDGSLLANSLKSFLGEELRLCQNCRTLNRLLALPFYEASGRILRVDKQFMKNNFSNSEYGLAWLKGFELMMKGIKEYGIRIPFTPAGPFEVVWNFTYLCNLKCVHCYQDAGCYRPELTTNEAYAVVDVLSRISRVGIPALSFSGGEPLLRKDFLEVAAYAKKGIPFISLATNGTLLTRDNVKMLKGIVDYIEISLDGSSKEVHESLRSVNGCFDKTMEGLHNCIDEGIDVCISTTVCKQNLCEVQQLIQLAEELGVRFMHFNYIPTGRAVRRPEYDLSPDERLLVLRSIARKLLDLHEKAREEERRTGKSSVVVGRFFSTCPQLASVTKEIAEERGSAVTISAHYAMMKVNAVANFLGGCGAGRLYVALEPNGDIKPCVFFPPSKDMLLGNILRDDFEQIWRNNEVLWRLRTRENLRSYSINEQHTGCGSCVDRYICGGCRARAYYYFETDLNGPDIGCIRNRDLWNRVVS